ncbi:MAG: hypothetical protein ACREPR_03420, partial [Brasilonema sp.]
IAQVSCVVDFRQDLVVQVGDRRSTRDRHAPNKARAHVNGVAEVPTHGRSRVGMDSGMRRLHL